MGDDHADPASSTPDGPAPVSVQDVRTSWGALVNRLAYQRKGSAHPIPIVRFGEPYIHALPPVLYEQHTHGRDLPDPVRLNPDPTDPTQHRVDWTPAGPDDKTFTADRIAIGSRQLVRNWERLHVQVAHYDKHVLVYRRNELVAAFVPLNWPAPPPGGATGP